MLARVRSAQTATPSTAIHRHHVGMAESRTAGTPTGRFGHTSSLCALRHHKTAVTLCRARAKVGDPGNQCQIRLAAGGIKKRQQLSEDLPQTITHLPAPRRSALHAGQRAGDVLPFAAHRPTTRLPAPPLGSPPPSPRVNQRLARLSSVFSAAECSGPASPPASIPPVEP